MPDTTQVAVTLHKPIYLPERENWRAERDDVILCRDWEEDADMVKLFGCSSGHDLVRVSRENIAGLVEKEHE